MTIVAIGKKYGVSDRSIAKWAKGYKIEYKHIKKKSFCTKCGKEVTRGFDRCCVCSSIEQRKINRPDMEILKEQIKEKGYNETGKIYSVSGSAIRQWIRFYKKHNI
jgi:hypothetical protein